MNIWLILWAILAVSLAVFMVWTFSILMRQKRAWGVYAKKRKLRYKSNAFMDAADVGGVIGNHTISIFESEHLSPDARGVRKLTAIEVNLNGALPINGGVASNGMIPILKALQFKHEYLPGQKIWKKSYVASTDNKNVMRAYMKDARVEAICKLMEIPNSWVILVFKDDVMLLRVDVADPLHDPKRLDARVKTLLEAAKALELVPGERKRLKAEMLKVASQGIELEVDDDVLEAPVTGIELELEDDGGAEEAAEVAEERGEAVDVAKVEDEPSVKKKAGPKENAKGDKPSASSKSSKKKK